MTPAITPELRERADLFYIVDLRPAWNRNPYVTFWRSDDAGYCYSLPNAGRYSRARVIEGGSYYTAKDWTSSKGPGRLWTRFAALCADVDALASEPDTEGRHRLDSGLTGKVILRNTGKMRTTLRRLRFVLPTNIDAPPATPLATGEAA